MASASQIPSEIFQRIRRKPTGQSRTKFFGAYFAPPPYIYFCMRPCSQLKYKISLVIVNIVHI